MFPLFTAVEERILAVAALGRMRVGDLAKKAKCSPKTVYKSMQKLEFREMFTAALRGNLHAETPSIVDVFVREALAGSYQHGKTILEITGVHTPKQQIDAALNVTSEDTPWKDEAEFQEFAKETLKRFGTTEDEDA